MRPKALPNELGAAGLTRRIGLLALLFAVIALLIATVPGIGEVRERFADARPGWLVVMVALEPLRRFLIRRQASIPPDLPERAIGRGAGRMPLAGDRTALGLRAHRKAPQRSQSD